MPLAGSLAAQSLLRSVVVIDEADPVRPAYFPRNVAFRSTLNEGLTNSVAIYAENLDLSRFGSPQFETIVGTYFREKYREKSIDLIVVNGSRALELILRLRANLWSGVPVVFSTVDEAAVARLKLPSDVTGTFLRRTLADASTAARALVPGLKRIALVGDTLELQRFRRPYLMEFSAVAAELELINLTGLPMRDLIARVSALPADTAIIYQGIWSGTTARDSTPEAALATIAAAANRPIVVDTEIWFGFGAAGGFLTRPALDGQVAAQVAMRILNGESAANIPVIVGDVNRPLFDWRQLKRFGISEATLPPRSEIQFRNPTVWDQYRDHILLIIAAIVIQAALISWLIYEHWRRQSAEADSLQRMNDLARLNRVETAGKLSASIAHEIRQPLAAIASSGSAGLNWLNNKVPDLDEARAALQAVITQSHRADDVIKSIGAMFRSEPVARVAVDLNDLVQQVLLLVERPMRSNSIVLKTTLEDRTSPLVMADPVQLQQVILNLIMNAIEAMSTSCRRTRVLHIETRFDQAGNVLLLVQDSGPGFDDKVGENMFKAFVTTKSNGMGMGLSICKSIVEQHQGTLTAASIKARGAMFQVVLPHADTNTG